MSRSCHHRVARVLAMLACVSIASPTRADDWVQFRGPRVDGISTEHNVFGPTVGLLQAWHVPIGSGYSGVAIAQGTVVTMYTEGMVDVVGAFDERSGKQLWRYELGAYYKGHDGSHDGPIATPLIHDGAVYVYGAHGHFAALDLTSGTARWSTNINKDHGSKEPFYGFGTSPFISNGVVVLEIGAPDAAIAGFDPATGKKLWTAGKDDGGVTYQTPVPMNVGGQDILLCAGMTKLFGLDVVEGRILWEQAYGGKGGRGATSLVPVPAGKNRVFLAHQDNASKVVALDGRGDDVTVSDLWENRSIRNSYNIPVYHDGHLYAYSSRFLTCVNADTGKSLWRSRAPGDGFVILVDGHLVILTKEGSVHVAEASTAGYVEKAGLAVFDDLAWTPPSFANGHIIARGLDGLARVKVTSEPVAATLPDPGSAPAGSAFAGMLKSLTTTSDKAAVLDRFFKQQEQFPIVENDNLVHFVYRGPGEDLALAGDMFGARREQRMIHVPDTDLFYYSLDLEADARLNYVFVRDYEMLVDPRNPRTTTTTLVGDEMEMSFDGSEMDMSWMAMPRWQKPLHLTEPSAERGRIETVKFESTVLKDQPPSPMGGPTAAEFDIDVYLPHGYDQGTTRYPVAYIHSGAEALTRGQLPTTADNLIGQRMAPAILVFIKTSPMTQKYSDMVVTELVPMIDQKYRTQANREGRASIGMGFAGGAAMTTAILNGDKFGKLGMISAVIFGFMAGDLKENMPENNVAEPLEVYMIWSTYDFRNPHEAWDMGTTNREYAEIFKTKGYPLTTSVVHDGSGWSSWRNHTDDLLENLFPKS